MYSNYQQYQQRGGQLPENAYQSLALRASEVIDYYTAGQAAGAAGMASALSACECELVDCFSQGGGENTGILSVNNDGYSVTYASFKERRQEVKGILARYLTFPENLLVSCGKAVV